MVDEFEFDCFVWARRTSAGGLALPFALSLSWALSICHVHCHCHVIVKEIAYNCRQNIFKILTICNSLLIVRYPIIMSNFNEQAY